MIHQKCTSELAKVDLKKPKSTANRQTNHGQGWETVTVIDGTAAYQTVLATTVVLLIALFGPKCTCCIGST